MILRNSYRTRIVNDSHSLMSGKNSLEYIFILYLLYLISWNTYMRNKCEFFNMKNMIDWYDDENFFPLELLTDDWWFKCSFSLQKQTEIDSGLIAWYCNNDEWWILFLNGTAQFLKEFLRDQALKSSLWLIVLVGHVCLKVTFGFNVFV